MTKYGLAESDGIADYAQVPMRNKSQSHPLGDNLFLYSKEQMPIQLTTCCCQLFAFGVYMTYRHRRMKAKAHRIMMPKL